MRLGGGGAHRARTRRCVAAVLVGVLVAGCTSPEPAPAPAPTATAEPTAPAVVGAAGAEVTVIVPPPSMVAEAEGAALARAATALASDHPDGIAEVLVVEAETEAFARDLADLAVDDGRDLVCVVGVGAAPLVLELARARRDGRFCTTDPRIEGGPVNLAAVGLDPSALVEAGAIALGNGPAPLGLLAAEPLGDVQALAEAFTSLTATPVLPPPSPPPTASTTTSADATGPAVATTPSPSTGPSGPAVDQDLYAIVTPGSSAAAQEDAGEELAARRPSRALVLATPGGAAAAAAAGATGAQLVAVSDWTVDAEGQLPAGLLVALTVDWGMLLRDAITAALDTEAPQVQRRGSGSGVLGALPGTVADAEPAAARTADHLARAIADAEGQG